jgi:hypothetical protein
MLRKYVVRHLLTRSHSHASDTFIILSVSSTHRVNMNTHDDNAVTVFYVSRILYKMLMIMISKQYLINKQLRLQKSFSEHHKGSVYNIILSLLLCIFNT